MGGSESAVGRRETGATAKASGHDGRPEVEATPPQIRGAGQVFPGHLQWRRRCLEEVLEDESRQRYQACEKGEHRSRHR